MENPKKPYKPKMKGMSFFAFIFSIFIYISIFYIFNLSPSTLFTNTKFWFLISNNLILIIAVDYGAFSSVSKDKLPIYNEYVMHSKASSNSSSFVLEYQEIEKKSNNTQKQTDKAESMQKKKEKESEHAQNQLQIVAVHEQEKPSINTAEDQDHIEDKMIVHVGKKIECESNKISEERRNTYRRSKSDKVKRVVINESKNSVILKRPETKKYGQENEGEAVNEFLTMSDEDLNRRVEEFIQRFNRQIRLQVDNYDN